MSIKYVFLASPLSLKPLSPLGPCPLHSQSPTAADFSKYTTSGSPPSVLSPLPESCCCGSPPVLPYHLPTDGSARGAAPRNPHSIPSSPPPTRIMTDQYLQEQHAYHIARRLQGAKPAEPKSETDHSSSWVMLRNNGDIVPLDNERIRHRYNKISFELTVPKALRQGRETFSHKSDNGTAILTTRRV